jgi:hypothetical protein
MSLEDEILLVECGQRRDPLECQKTRQNLSQGMHVERNTRGEGENEKHAYLIFGGLGLQYSDEDLSIGLGAFLRVRRENISNRRREGLEQPSSASLVDRSALDGTLTWCAAFGMAPRFETDMDKVSRAVGSVKGRVA